MKQLLMYSILLFLLHTQAKHFPYRAFCHEPVADLFTFIASDKSAEQAWDIKKMPAPYPRASQLLFNEQVMVTEEKNGYAHVNVSHWFYTPPNSTKPAIDYWTPVTGLTACDSLDSRSSACVPEPISFKEKNLYYDNVATLKHPYTIDGITYSAGTRFVKVHPHKNSESCSVKIYKPKTDTYSICSIPASYIQDAKISSHESKRSLFLSLVESWTEKSSECFPYVLGGGALTHRRSANEPISTKIIEGKTFYYRPLQTSPIPTGIDCSQLIARAAHIAQIPLFAKNTATFITAYPSITREYQIKNGDFVVWRGHCFIIADVQNNLAIEARGYGSGYGKIQKIPLKELFKNVRTYRDLLQKYWRKQPLLRMDKAGNIIQTIDEFKIIPLIL